MLSLQPQSEDPAQKHPARSVVGPPAAGRHGHHRLPADLPPQTWKGGKQHPNQSPLPEDRHWRRRRILAKHRHQVSAAGLAASTGDQLRHRDQRLRLQRRRSGCHLSRAGRGRTGERYQNIIALLWTFTEGPSGLMGMWHFLLSHGRALFWMDGWLIWLLVVCDVGCVPGLKLWMKASESTLSIYWVLVWICN